MNSKLKINDIAKALNVSNASVSRALNNKEGVSEQLKVQILNYVEKVGYKPNTLAQGLSKGRLNLIALILSDIRNPFYTELVFNIQQKVNEQGFMLVTFNTEYIIEKELEIISTIGQYSFSGLILLSAQSELAYTELKKLKMPVVFVNRILSSFPVDSVLMDNFKAGYIAASHLINLGHKKIGFVKGAATSSASDERYRGYKEAMKTFQLDYLDKEELSCNWTLEAGRESAKALLTKTDKNNRPTAMILVNDMAALGFIDYCLNVRLKIPEDISVVSFDNIAIADLNNIKLTTISQSAKKMAFIAAEMILKRILGDLSDMKRIVIEPELIVRETTSKPKRI